MSVAEFLDGAAPGKHGVTLLPPIDAPEVWAFGVTYMDSMRERQAESGTPDIYAKVYDAVRPEAFFKSTFERLQAPFAEVGIRGDSEWNVPEPELAFVTYGGKIVGYTCGNDMSSRTIEGENPLYLPQAKVYDKSTSLGPALATPETVGDPQKLAVTLVIERDGKEAFRGETNTSEMKRDCAYLADWLVRHNAVPDGTTAMTGTGTIPPPEFTLTAGDVISVTTDMHTGGVVPNQSWLDGALAGAAGMQHVFVFSHRPVQVSPAEPTGGSGGPFWQAPRQPGASGHRSGPGHPPPPAPHRGRGRGPGAGGADVDPRLLEILVGPGTHGPLRYDRERQELISEQAGLAYPVRDGIPIMLADEARPLDAEAP